MVKLSIKNLTTGYNEREVLRDISFEIERGDFIGIIGPNGSGKSTFVKAATGVLKAWEGDIRLDDDSVYELSRTDIAKNIAVVPQDTFISFPYTSWEVVLMGRTPYLSRFENPSNKDKNISKQAMKDTNTFQFKDRSVRELSGGELQRVVLARALAQDPRFLFLDEATSHLDIGNKIEVMDLIKRKNERGLSVISIHHNLNLAARYCEKLILLDEGEIHAIGPPKEVLTRPHLKAVYGIGAEVHENPRTGNLYISPTEERKTKPEKEIKIHVVGGGGTAGDILKRLVEEGYQVSTGVLNVMDSDLERANFLGVKAITEAPFSAISDETMKENLLEMLRSDKIIVTNFPIGEGNLRNLKSVFKAAKKGKEIIVIEKDPIEERDYSKGSKGSFIFKKIKEMDNVTTLKNEDYLFDYL